jgi:eukaryotic-like serine/threonine-protein kinase
MNRWQEIERLFLAASELSAEDRAAFLDREAGGDLELRAAVEGMLRHSNEGETRFQAAVGQGAVAAALAPEPDRTRIDKYAIVRELGRGGMGTVYLAERTGQEFQQQVAIKVVKRGMDTAQIIERFRHERRILASLDHPNIARLFDGGATAEGLPYLVMEYIEGRPLVDYCREGGLSIRERLQLFEQVCSAVQHAHQKLVVHRDIKPANILVTSSGVPKLLDFGIAKLLLPDATDGEWQTLTQAGMRLLTPDYASPEQVRGDPVSVATDIYSLGAVLYELLTGKRPHQLRNYTETEFAVAICETEVKPPSEAAEEARLKRELSGDLDNIVGLALRKDPSRRYVSVEQFATDIRRYLEGRPVVARPETFFYRAQKFVTRNRIPVMAALLVLLSLTAGIVATILQARRADAQAARAERRFQQVRKLANTFVFDIYDGMANVPGTAKLRASVVATALEYLDSLASEAEGDTALQLELAAAYKRIADVQGNPSLSGLGQTEAALASYGKASAVLNQLADRQGSDPKVLADLANLERTIGFMILNIEQPSKAIAHQQKSIAVWERRNPQRGQDLESDTGIAQAWGLMGQALHAQGEAKAAVERHKAAVDLLSSWLPRKTAPNTRGIISTMLYDLAEARRDSGDLNGAVEAYRESARIRKEILQANTKHLGSRRRVMLLNIALADVTGNALNLSLGDSETAQRYAGEALRQAEAIAKEDGGSFRSGRDRALANLMMAYVLLATEPRRAVPLAQVALEGTAGQGQIEANAQEALARGLLATGDRKRALELIRSAVETMDQLSQKTPRFIDYRFDLVRLCNLMGDQLPPSQAGEFYRMGYEAAALFPEASSSIRALASRAETDMRWDRWNPEATVSERRSKLERALQIFQKLATQAPGNAAVQAKLADVRRSLSKL